MTITQVYPSLGADRLLPAEASGTELHPRSSGPLGLLDLLQSYVAETAELLPRAEPGLTERSYELLELTDELEIWAIHWPQGQGLELHDHGGSVGALWVVEGALEEHYVRPEHHVRPERALGRRSIVSGGGAAFGPHYVHDVVNAQAAPATSVHAYSPPMASMTFYRQEERGLVVDRAEYRADPSWAP
jgi:predicted metal-dependent enzyme (double-stranded beta helix superfamily)